MSQHNTELTLLNWMKLAGHAMAEEVLMELSDSMSDFVDSADKDEIIRAMFLMLLYYNGALRRMGVSAQQFEDEAIYPLSLYVMKDTDGAQE